MEIYWLTFDGPLAASFWSSYGYPRKMHVSKPFPQALFDRIKQEIGSTDPEVFRNTLSLLCQLFSLLGRGDSFSEAGLVPRALELIRELPSIKAILDKDVEAAYMGDPAAKSTDEIMLTYPAFEAISVFRIAHKRTRRRHKRIL